MNAKTLPGRWILFAFAATGCATQTEVPDDSSEQAPVAVTAQALIPSPDTSCTSADFNGKKYFFCLNDRSPTTAETKCNTAHPQFHLASIESAAENEFIRTRILVDSWVSGTDAQVEGTWKWQTGTQFWLGGSGGSSGGQYANWASGQPNNTINQDCMVIDDNSPGRWSDESCSGTRDYVCEGDGCPTDPSKTDPGQCGCNNPDTDGDGDGVANCIDGCPADPNKTAPGVCNCGTPDTDSDGDGTANCNDACPNDASRTALPCAPEAGCTFATFGGSNYFFCAVLRSHGAARTKCGLSAMQLAQIDSAAENTWIDQRVVTDRWIDGSDATTEGSWKWLTSGKPFWQGNFNGSAVAGAYTNWATGQPNDLAFGGQDCLTIFGSANGKWDDEHCSNELEQYVCEDACPSTAKTSPGQCGCDYLGPETDGDGDGTLDCIDGCPSDSTKTSPGQCDCGFPDTDGDGDGVADCLDACPDDTAKSDPGVCDCGVPDVDTDGDTTFDCVDDCPLDPLRVVRGQCGCVGEPFPLPEGTPCSDGPCADECDGAGSCGSPTLDECIPPGQHDCTLLIHDAHPYVFCTDNMTPNEARDVCDDVGMELVRIDDAAEDAFVADNLDEPSWIGATDAAIDGEWRWMDGDTQFWQGGAGGAAVNNAYENWESSEPGAANPVDDCAIYDLSGSGSPLGWDDRDCGTQHGFVCEIVDQCPADPTKDKHDFCECGELQVEVTIDGQQVVQCLDLCPEDPLKRAPGKCGCGRPEGLCPIECPNNLSDPSSPVYGKLQAGRCGCDTPDVDGNNNDVLDCFEGTSQCEIAGVPAPPGTACTDSICPSGCPIATQCDGNGVCGDPDACAPTGGGNCFWKLFRDNVYWFCDGQLTREEAQAVCAQDGDGYLVSIGDEAENEFIQANVNEDSWTGGNQSTVEDEWQWANATCEDSEPFWNGDETGGPHRDIAYADWQSGTSLAGAYAVVEAGAAAGEGSWRTQSGGTLAFVCEKPRPVPPVCGDPPECMAEYLGLGPCPPTNEPCVPLEEALTEGLVDLEPAAAKQAVEECGTHCNPDTSMCTGDHEECEQACLDACTSVGIDIPAETDTCDDTNGGDPEFGENCLLDEVSLDGAGDPIPCQNTDQCLDLGLSADTVCGLWRACRNHDSSEDDLDVCPAGVLPDDLSGGKTGTIRLCGIPSDKCLIGDPNDPQRCVSTPLICEPEDGRQVVEDIVFGPDGPPEPVCPAELFDEPPVAEPDLTAEIPSWELPCGELYPNGCPPDQSGEAHPYCKFRPAQDGEVRNAIDPEKNNVHGETSNSTANEDIINFEFEPRLDLTYKADIGPLGVPDIEVVAGAGLEAKAVINEGKLPFGGDVEIINLTAKATATQCTVNTNGSAVKLFKHDFLPAEAKIDETIPGCQEAFDKFETYANKASKAMRDVATLLKQYENLQEGERLDFTALCAAGGLLDDPPEDFPLPLNCDEQPAESHINELIMYYEGQVEDLLQAGAELANSASLRSGPQTMFELPGGDEEVTLFTANFLVGPIPVVLEAYVAASYSIALTAEYWVEPAKAVAALAQLNPETGRPHELIGVKVDGGPSASAFLGFFAGAGFDFGPVGASIGIEARLTLGVISLTANGGAGLIMTGRPDPRPLGSDLDTLVLREDDEDPDSAPETLIAPLLYELRLGYSAELTAKIRRILSGDVNARLKLKFFFFSKTYRQRLLKFDGFCTSSPAVDHLPCTIPILTLRSDAKLAEFPWATIRMSQILPKLAYLPFKPEPEPTDPAPTAVPVKTDQLEELFFDRLCSCVDDGDPCDSTGDCCEGLECADDGTGATTCGCRTDGETCATTDDCCGGLECSDDGSGVLTCGCRTDGESCGADGDCCSGTCADDGTGNLTCGCQADGDTCATGGASGDCCGGAECVSDGSGPLTCGCRLFQENCATGADCCGNNQCLDNGAGALTCGCRTISQPCSVDTDCCDDPSTPTVDLICADEDDTCKEPGPG